jgi:3-oxoacyl-[acyl-carrier protein] reductase
VDVIRRVFAKELGPRRICVNSVNPGVVDTEGNCAAGNIGGDFEKQAAQQAPLGRIGRDVAPAVVFPASDDTRWVTGEILVMSGGL